jgi:hypothetical protein
MPQVLIFSYYLQDFSLSLSLFFLQDTLQLCITSFKFSVKVIKEAM